jgi:hypothetical protein
LVRQNAATITTVAFGLVAAAIIVPLALASGVPAFQHDWLWPADRVQCNSYAMLGMSPWLQNGAGMPASYPQFWVPYAASGMLCDLAGPRFGLCLFLFAIVAIGALGVVYLCRSFLAIPPYVNAAAVILFWGNPVVLNEMHAGHLFFLWSYALLPAVIGVTLHRNRTPFSGFYAGALLGLASAQQQFLAIGVLVMALLLIATYKRGDGRFLAVALAVGLGVTSPAWILAAIANPEQILGAQHPQMHWELAQSAPFLDAVRLIGYIGHYDTAISPLSASVLFLTPLVALAGAFVVTSNRRTVFVLAALAIVAITLCWGLDGPAAAVLAAAFAGVPAFALFRELYNFAGLAQTCFVVLIVIWLSRTLDDRRLRPLALVVGIAIMANALYIATQSSIGLPDATLTPAEHETMRELAQRKDPGRFITVPAIVPQSLRGDETRGGFAPWTIPVGSQSGTSVPLAPFPLVFAAQDLDATTKARVYERLGIERTVPLSGVVTNLNVEPALRSLNYAKSIDVSASRATQFPNNGLVAVETFSAGLGTIASAYQGARDIGPFGSGAKQVRVGEGAGYNPLESWAPLSLFPGLASWMYVLPSGTVTMRESAPLPFDATFVVAGSADGSIASNACSLYARIDAHFAVYRCTHSGIWLRGRPPIVISSASDGPIVTTQTPRGASGQAEVIYWTPWQIVLHVRAIRASVLVLRETYDSAWRCTGCGDAEHRHVDGYANGWVFQTGVDRNVTLYFEDAAAYFVCLALSIALLSAAAIGGVYGTARYSASRKARS